MQPLKKKKIMKPLKICISPTIRIGQEGWCLPYARFFKLYFESVYSLCPVFVKCKKKIRSI